MKKRFLSLILAVVAACSLAIPAAAQAADERLSAVTAQVKQTLALDTNAYPEFYGDLDEDALAPTWHLEWSGAENSLSVSATEEGKILSYYVNEPQEERRSGAFAPTFPAGNRDAARSAAQSFLKKVLTKGETSTIEDRGADRLNATTYRFRGEILLSGLSAGLSYSIAVRCEDNRIMSFSRDDLNGVIMGGIPSAAPKVLSGAAGSALKRTLSLRLEYVLAEDGGTTAVLRYLPKHRDDYYVDARTGELVNLDELASGISNGDTGAGAAYTSAAEDTAKAPEEAALTGAEQAGAAKLEGVLSRESLDAKALAISQLGLNAYTLSAVNYSVSKEGAQDQENSVTASLRYGRQVNGASWRRTVTLDAKTGELLSVYSSAWMPEQPVKRTADAAAAQRAAEAFLNGQCASQFAKTALYDSSDAMDQTEQLSHGFTFAEKANGYFFPANSIRVGVDATDGSISYYEKQFDDTVAFDSPSGILTADQALDAWMATYTVELQFIQVPTAVDFSQPEYGPLKDFGIAYLYQLVLGYALEREEYLSGIDAKTGRSGRHHLQ